MRKPLILFLTLCLLFTIGSCDNMTTEPRENDSSGKILMILAADNVYYSEYIISYKALIELGYEIELVSVKNQDVSVYMVPEGTTIEETANTFPGNNKYEAFKAQYKDLFGADWEESLNTMPAKISGIKSVLSIEDMDGYSGIVIPGGTGILNLRTDGNYSTQAGIAATEIEAAAMKINALATEALKSGKPILAQCHGASLPVFWKIDGTSIPLLFGQIAAGYPDPATQSTYELLGAQLRADDKVVVANPNEALINSKAGDSKVVTSRDWYPQTVAHATKVFANILETYPNLEHLHAQKKVLILHGGAIDEINCSATNRVNDVPCNYGGGTNLPADYTHVKALLQTVGNDGFQFVVSDLNITSTTLPYAPSDPNSIEDYFADFDAIVFFKHWSTGVNTALQMALINYADNGGGVLAIHHALYNDIDDTNSALNKNSLTTQLFGATSEEQGWSATRDNYKLFSTNLGHFISTFHLQTNDIQEDPFSLSGVPILKAANRSLSYYPIINIFDEIYNNKSFVPSIPFGNDVNQITPLYSNSLPGAQAHTDGFVRLFNKNNDSKIGRIACFQSGENRLNFSIDGDYAQVIRNSIVWITYK